MSSKKPQSAELHPGPGFRIRTDIKRPSASLSRAFAEFETPDISDLLNRLYAMDTGISNVVNDQSLAGPACTVKVFPGDNLMVHKALDVAQPGDIIVIDTSESEMTAVLGDLVASKAKHRGIAGFIIDGLIRDLPAMQDVGLPVFARGTTPIGPLHRGPGEINYPVSCGGVVVEPGDIIVADANGVVAVRKDIAQDLLQRLRLQRNQLAEYVKNVKAGKFSNDWVDRMLAEQGCETDPIDLAHTA